MISRHLDDRYVAQHAFRGEQPGLLVEDAAHVLVRRDQPLHQHVGVAGDHGGDGLLHALHVVGFVHDVEGLQVEAVLLADPFDRGLVAVERRLHQPLLVGLIDGLQRMRILPVGYGKTFFTSLSRLFADFRNAGKIELRQRLTTVKSRGGQRFQIFRQPHLRQRRTALKYALTQLGYAIGQRNFLQLCTVIKSSVLNGGQCIRQVHLRQRAICKHHRCQFGDSFFYMDNFNIAAAKHLFTHML